MVRMKRLLLAFALALGLAATAVNYLPLAAGAAGLQIAGSRGEKADAGRESSYQLGFIDDEEIIEQVAGSKGENGRNGRDPSILGATPDELQVASAPGCGKPPVASACRESS